MNFQRTEYQSDAELYKTLFILLGSFLLLVIWLLIVTLAVLCKKRHSGEEYDVTKQDDDPSVDFIDQNVESSYNSKEETKPEDYNNDNFAENNTPDVLQAVKLWYV